MLLTSILFTLLLIDYTTGIPKPSHYVFICGFQRCDLRSHWCDKVAGECLSCWRYCNKPSNRNIFAKLCQGDCIMYTNSLNHSEVLNAGSGSDIENNVPITSTNYYPTVTDDSITTELSAISVSSSTRQLTDDIITTELPSISVSSHQLPSDVIVTTEIPAVNSFEILRKLDSKLKLIQIPVIKALGISVVLLSVVILLLTINIHRIKESHIINSCFARIRTSNPESNVIFRARADTQPTGIINSACTDMCEMSDLEVSKSTCRTSVKETTV